jgi:hypothetical protein
MMVIRGAQGSAKRPAVANASDEAARTDPMQTRAAEVFADEVAAGRRPSIRAIRARLYVGQPRAQQIQAHLGVARSFGVAKVSWDVAPDGPGRAFATLLCRCVLVVDAALASVVSCVHHFVQHLWWNSPIFRSR